MLGIKQKEKSAIPQEMHNAELILRYFTFKDNWNNFSMGEGIWTNSWTKIKNYPPKI